MCVYYVCICVQVHVCTCVCGSQRTAMAISPLLYETFSLTWNSAVSSRGRLVSLSVFFLWCWDGTQSLCLLDKLSATDRNQ